MFYKYRLLQMYPCSDFNHSTDPVHQPGSQLLHGGSTTAPTYAATWLQPFHLRDPPLDLYPVAVCTIQLLSGGE